jgi:hypothetical protein
MGIPSGLPFLSAQLVKPSTRPLCKLDWTLTFITEQGMQYHLPFSILHQANTTLRHSSFHLATAFNTDPKPFTLVVIAALVFS